MAKPISTADEIRRSRELAEASREVEWKGKGFLRELFLGRFELGLVHPYPLPGPQRPELKEWLDAFERFLRERVDSRRLDELGEYPGELLEGLRDLGAFGMKIPAEYGGLGFSEGVRDGDEAARQRGRERHGAPVGAPVDRRAAAARAVRVGGAQAQVPAPVRRGGDQRLHLDRDDRGVRPRAAVDDRRAGGGRPVLRPQRLEAVVHERRPRGAARRHRARPEDRRAQRLRRRDELARRRGDPPAPLHGAARHLERRAPVHGREGPAREPHREGGAGPQDRAHDAQHRAARAAGGDGGRGYESASSLESRGEAPVPVEQWMRDTRIDLIFEGSSEIMHLFIAREAVDKHLQIAGKLIDPRVPPGEKLRALPRIAAFYAPWYLGLWLRGAFPARHRGFGRLARHLRFVERKSRKLAREIFHAMVVFRAGAERRQAFLFRVVDVACELFAMAASALRADAIRRAGLPEAPKAEALADQFCAGARRKVQRLFHQLWRNDDRSAYRTGRAVLAGEHAWLEEGGVGLGLSIEDLRPRVPPRLAPRQEGLEAAPED